MATFDAVQVRELIRCWSLLAVMTLVIAPRVYLHHCELTHGTVAQHGAAFKAHCDVCDEVAPLQALCAAEPQRHWLFLDLQWNAPAPEDPFLGHAVLETDRGPPMRS